MDRRGGDAERSLRYHAGLLGPLDAGNDIASIVQTTEDARYIYALSLLDLVHQLTDIVGNGIHAQGIQAAVEHVGLNAHLVERLTKSAHRIVRILACQQVHLLKGTTVGFHTGEATHVDNDGSNAL